MIAHNFSFVVAPLTSVLLNCKLLVIVFRHHLLSKTGVGGQYLQFLLLLFSLGLIFSLQSKSWPKAEHYIHCVIHHPPPTQNFLKGSKPSRRLIFGIRSSHRSSNLMRRFGKVWPTYFSPPPQKKNLTHF